MLLQKSGGGEARDPWIIFHEGYFYHCFACATDTIGITKSKTVEGLSTEKPIIVYKAEPNKEYSKELWAPELHVLDGKCYIYVACDDGDNYNHRMYVLKNDSIDPTKPYVMGGKIATKTDKWAIDGTVFTFKGERYMVWSGWEGDVNVCQNTYIAKMSDPFTFSTDRVLISEPDLDWERVNCDGKEYPYINEGPCAYIKDGVLKLLYSASHSWWNTYCIGVLTLVGDDPLKRESWQKQLTPALSTEYGLSGPGHCSVFTHNGVDYIAYHAFDEGKTMGWTNAHAEVFPFKLKDGKIILLGK